jgi:hypothetical protein
VVTRCLYLLRNVQNARSFDPASLNDLFLVVKSPAADATDTPQPWGFLCNPMMKMKMMFIIFYPFPNSGAPVEWNWQRKTEVLGEKPVPVPLCPPQILHGLTRDRTRASADAYWGSLPMSKRPERVFSSLPPSSAEVKEGWSYTSTPRACLPGINRKNEWFIYLRNGA